MQQTLGVQALRSAIDVGAAKARSRTSAGIDQFAITLLLTTEQYLTFLTFFRSAIGGGAIAFAWRNPLTGRACDFRIIDQPTITSTAARNSAARKLRVNFRVELLPGTETDAGATPAAPTNRAGGGAGQVETIEPVGWAEYQEGDDIEVGMLSGLPPFAAVDSEPAFYLDALSSLGASPDSPIDNFTESEFAAPEVLIVQQSAGQAFMQPVITEN